jgi:high-affinity Fe2+/Pb2+ permease
MLSKLSQLCLLAVLFIACTVPWTRKKRKTKVSKITWQGLLVGVVIGIVLAPQISKLPLVNKIPQV